jgi:hypothetical protein
VSHVIFQLLPQISAGVLRVLLVLEHDVSICWLDQLTAAGISMLWAQQSWPGTHQDCETCCRRMFGGEDVLSGPSPDRLG